MGFDRRCQRATVMLAVVVSGTLQYVVPYLTSVLLSLGANVVRPRYTESVRGLLSSTSK
jgi:hypothetical protein